MPYPYRRSRRGYGRRRRYARRSARRPNASRATPRITFAPRHQYLKLKAAWSYYQPSGVQAKAPIMFRLDNPHASVQSATGWQIENTQDPLGWDAYSNLFSRYVVHGSKWNIRVFYQSGSASVSSWQAMVNWAVQTDSTSTDNNDKLRSMPIGGSFLASTEKPGVLKRYFNQNRIMGLQVTKYDRFYHEWFDVDGANSHSRLRLVPEISAYAGVQVQITVTWYVSAVSSNAVAGDPAAVMALKQFTEPFVDGPEDEPDAAQYSQAINTGFTNSKSALVKARLGGHKRSLSTDK